MKITSLQPTPSRSRLCKAFPSRDRQGVGWLICAAILAALPLCAQLKEITINYPAKAPANWPLFVAKEGGYYQKYGFNAKMVFAPHPAGIAMLVGGDAQMTNYSLEQAMQAASKDGSLVIMGSPMQRGLFAMMASKQIKSVKDLKGKRFGVTQLNDPPYSFAVAILGKYGIGPKDVSWVPLGTDGNGRIAALVGGRPNTSTFPTRNCLPRQVPSAARCAE